MKLTMLLTRYIRGNFFGLGQRQYHCRCFQIPGSQAKVSTDNSADSSLCTIEQNKEKDEQSRDVPDVCELTILEVVNDNQSFGKATAEIVPFSPSDGESNYIGAPQSKVTEDTSHDSSILTIGQNQVEGQLSQDGGKHE